MAQTETHRFPDGDFVQRLNVAWAAVEHALKAEEKNPPVLLEGEDPPSVVLALEHQALKDEADADAESKRRVVTVAGVRRQAWRELKEKHPPRSGEGVDPEDVKADRLAGVNTDAVGDDLLYVSVVHPSFTSRADFDEWLDQWSEGEYQTLLRMAWEKTQGGSYDPKSHPVSLSLSSGKS